MLCAPSPSHRISSTRFLSMRCRHGRRAEARRFTPWLLPWHKGGASLTNYRPVALLLPRLWSSALKTLACGLLAVWIANVLHFGNVAQAQTQSTSSGQRVADQNTLPPVPKSLSQFTGANAQSLIPKDLVTFSTRIQPAQPRPEEHARLLITVRIREGWTVYSIAPQTAEFAPPPTRVRIQSSVLEPIGPAYETNPKQKIDPVLRETLWVHQGKARLYQNLKAAPNAPLGKATLQTQLHYQACSDRICTPQLKAQLDTPFTLQAGDVRPAYAYMERTVDFIDKQGRLHEDPSKIDAALSQGLSGFLLLAVSFGFLALLTPCVFPMIPVTVGFFTQASARQQPGQNQPAAAHRPLGRRTGNADSIGGTKITGKPPTPGTWHGVKLAGLFGAGLVLTSVGVGLLLTFLLGAAGVNRFASHPVVNLAIAGFFALFALNLLGVLRTGLRAEWIGRINLFSQGLHGPVGAVMMGVAFTITSFTCTMPFVGSLLVTAAQGDLFWPVLGMSVFAFVFAAPFVLLALFPQVLHHFKGKSGEWLNWVKFALGAVELMAALKFVGNADLILNWNIFTREVILALWGLIALIAAITTLGWLPWPWLQIHQLTRRWRLGGGISFAVLGLWFGYGLQGGALASVLEAQLPPPLPKSVAALGLNQTLDPRQYAALEDKRWLNSLPQALKRAKASNKRVFVDFTGYTCINCRWMERTVLEKPAVIATLEENFVLVRLYTDGGPDYETHQALQVQRFGTIALPFYVVLSPKNTLLARWAGVFANPKTFLTWLQSTALHQKKSFF